LFSFGLGRFGILGHGEEQTWQIPRQVMSLQRHRVKQVALGKYHALCVTYAGKLYSWGRNDMGQLGRGHKSPMELVPGLAADINTDREHTQDISCGVNHSMAIVRVSASHCLIV
jgi:alpha-tubulin suppressor-like RCC1 family protein